MGLGVAAAIAVIAASKQTRWIKEDAASFTRPKTKRHCRSETPLSISDLRQ